MRFCTCWGFPQEQGWDNFICSGHYVYHYVLCLLGIPSCQESAWCAYTGYHPAAHKKTDMYAWHISWEKVCGKKKTLMNTTAWIMILPTSEPINVIDFSQIKQSWEPGSLESTEDGKSWLGQYYPDTDRLQSSRPKKGIWRSKTELPYKNVYLYIVTHLYREYMQIYLTLLCIIINAKKCIWMF